MFALNRCPSLAAFGKRCFSSPVNKCDAIVLGSGISGAAVSYRLKKLQGISVVCLEKEEMPGYGATGKAFGIFAESLARTVETKRMTALSRSWFMNPDEECIDHEIDQIPILQKTGLFAVSSLEDYPFLYEHFGPNEKLKFTESIQVLPRKDVTNSMPFLDETNVAPNALFEPNACNFNTGLVYEHFVVGGHNVGVRYMFHESAVEINKLANGNWEVLAFNSQKNSIDRFEAGLLVNCCGVAADEMAVKAGVAPINLQTHKRNVIAFTFESSADIAKSEQQSAWLGFITPETSDIFHACFQGNSGVFLYDKLVNTTDFAHKADYVTHDEMENAICKINKYTKLKVKKVMSQTAGIKCSVEQDRNMVIGASDDDASFIWCAAMSSYGIMTAPCYSLLVSYTAVGKSLPAQYEEYSTVDMYQLSPSRLNANGNAQAKQ